MFYESEKMVFIIVWETFLQKCELSSCTDLLLLVLDFVFGGLYTNTLWQTTCVSDEMLSDAFRQQFEELGNSRWEQTSCREGLAYTECIIRCFNGSTKAVEWHFKWLEICLVTFFAPYSSHITHNTVTFNKALDLTWCLTLLSTFWF